MVVWYGVSGGWQFLITCLAGEMYIFLMKEAHSNMKLVHIAKLRPIHIHIYSGEILRLTEDELLRKHLSRMFSLIKNESVGIEDD